MDNFLIAPKEDQVCKFTFTSRNFNQTEEFDTFAEAVEEYEMNLFSMEDDGYIELENERIDTQNVLKTTWRDLDNNRIELKLELY